MAIGVTETLQSEYVLYVSTERMWAVGDEGSR